MNRQKLTFFAIVAAALLVVGLVSVFGGLLAADPEDAVTGSSTDSAPKPTAPTGPLSGAGETWNGLRIEVVDVEPDGWPLIKAHNQFNDPPGFGRRMLLITLRVSSVRESDEGPVSIDASDFKVVGEREEVYTTYGDDTRCGVVPDALDGVVTADHWIRGAICVQVPEKEEGFTLIYEPFIGDEPAVYIPIPAGQ